MAIRKHRPFLISFRIERNGFRKGDSIFAVSGGRLTIQISSRWDRGGIGVTNFRVQPINNSPLPWDTNGDEISFSVGSDTHTWTDLDDGDYLLSITVSDHRPGVLLGDGRVS